MSNSNSQTNKNSVPANARVVIIGGGVMGCALAYHLAHLGWTDIVLFEKGELTSGSTWHAAGQGTYSTTHYGIAKCVGYNIDLYKNRLEAETGQSVTWHGCGSLRMAYTQDELDWLKQTLSVGAATQLPMEILDPAAIERIHPFYNLDGIIAALHTPTDGHVDPAGATFALAKGARQLGVNIMRQTRVTGVKQQANGEWCVQSEKGDVVCEHVVNAGGTYARQMALWNGYDLPTTSMTHHYIVTDTVPEFQTLDYELPVVRDDRNVSGYIRMEQKSGLIGIYETKNPNPVWTDGAPWEAEHELFEPHYDRIMPWLEQAFHRMPIFAELSIKKTIHGAISHPPDGNPLLGPAPGLRNYWVCAGCQIGLGWGPGLTRELARWMVEGGADINMRDFDPRRFGKYADQQYQITKAEEDYRMRHALPYPHFSRIDMRPARTSPLYERLQAKGAVYEEVSGWERPRWFATGDIPAEDIYSFRRSQLHDIIANEVKAVHTAAGVIDISAFAKVEVSGRGAADFVEQIIPNKLPAVGKIGLAHLLSDGGRISVEVTITRFAEDVFYFGSAPFFETRLRDYLTHAAQDCVADAVDIINRSDEWAAMALNGPRARDILSACTDTALDNAAFPWMSVQQINIAGQSQSQSVWALRMSYAGELGWELHGARDAIAAAYDTLMQHGAAHGLTDYGLFALNSLRMEKAFHGAAELTNEVTLPEAGVMRFCKLDKKSFIGKDATVAAANAPLRWQCAYLEVEEDGENDGNGNEGVLSMTGERIGVVSSIAYGHRVGKLLAFAYVQTQHAAAGGEVQVVIMGQPRKATVLAKPVYDADNQKPRA